MGEEGVWPDVYEILYISFSDALTTAKKNKKT